MSSNENKISFDTQKKDNKVYDEVELISASPKISTSTETSGIIQIKDKNFINNNISKTSSINTSIGYTDLVFGVSIDIHNPRKLGSVNAFFYIKNFPVFIIGPDCK